MPERRGDNSRPAHLPTPVSATSHSLPPTPADQIANRLGYLALLPFVVGAFAIWFVRADARGMATMALSAYAATVVSFIGGIYWGFGFHSATPRAGLFVWGVVPALVACVALLMQPAAGLVIHGAMLIVCYLVDRRVYPTEGAARWLVLRFRLSGVASLACFLGAAGN